LTHRSNGFGCSNLSRERDGRCNLYVAYDVSAALTPFDMEIVAERTCDTGFKA